MCGEKETRGNMLRCPRPRVYGEQYALHRQRFVQLYLENLGCEKGSGKKPKYKHARCREWLLAKFPQSVVELVREKRAVCYDPALLDRVFLSSPAECCHKSCLAGIRALLYSFSRHESPPPAKKLRTSQLALHDIWPEMSATRLGTLSAVFSKDLRISCMEKLERVAPEADVVRVLANRRLGVASQAPLTLAELTSYRRFIGESADDYIDIYDEVFKEERDFLVS